MNITEVTTFLQKDIATAMDKLHENSTPQWGAMEAQEMIEHVAMAIKGGYALEFTADKEPKPAQLQAKEAFLVQDIPYPKGIQSPFHKNGKPAYAFKNLEEAKQNLLSQIKLLYDFFEKEENKNKFFFHPFFGKLNFEEIQKFIYKHTKHHFEQFGLI